ncbi:hypothetical protein [uncultured Brevundimonas sp.]|uniref:hypothetical protein n=1 Tax=uncultured Brevundimonas sp. TaxID=213418 RepID=UPI002631C616|nr:hypothetical protein [uncultured Brevundimonas sp.]
MRVLTLEEVRAVAGGGDVTDLGTIKVTARKRTPEGWVLPEYGRAEMFAVSEVVDSFYGGSGVSIVAQDTDSIDIDVDIGRDLTVEEKKVIEDLKAAIREVTASINSLSSTVVITMPDGSQLTGNELKELWSKTDFKIVDVPNGDPYGNNGTGGAFHQNGDPLFVIDINGANNSSNMGLMGYAANGQDGLNFYILHELAHVTSAGVAKTNELGSVSEDLERWTNTLATGIANAAGVSVGGFSPTYGVDSQPATVSSATSGGAAGSGSSGGGSSGDSGSGRTFFGRDEIPSNENIVN